MSHVIETKNDGNEKLRCENVSGRESHSICSDVECPEPISLENPESVVAGSRRKKTFVDLPPIKRSRDENTELDSSKSIKKNVLSFIPPVKFQDIQYVDGQSQPGVKISWDRDEEEISFRRKTRENSPSAKTKISLPEISSESSNKEEEKQYADEFDDLDFFDTKVKDPVSDYHKSSSTKDIHKKTKEVYSYDVYHDDSSENVQLEDNSHINAENDIPERAFPILGINRKHSDIEIKEITQESILEDQSRYRDDKVFTTNYGIDIARNRIHAPTSVMKRSHNIMSLAYEANMNSEAFEAAKKHSQAIRKISKKTYGF